MTAIDLVGVKKSFGTNRGLSIDRLEIEAGEVVAVVGRNGAGKTTLLKILGLLLTPDAGTVKLFGNRVAASPPLALRRRVTYLAQNPYLFRGRVIDELERGLVYRGIAPADRRKRSESVLGDLGLDGFESRDTRALSGGETLRVALGRALVIESELLLLDEPTANLDDVSTTALEKTLERLRGARTVLFATHDREFADRFASRVIELASGALV